MVQIVRNFEKLLEKTLGCYKSSNLALLPFIKEILVFELNRFVGVPST